MLKIQVGLQLCQNIEWGEKNIICLFFAYLSIPFLLPQLSMMFWSYLQNLFLSFLRVNDSVLFQYYLGSLLWRFLNSTTQRCNFKSLHQAFSISCMCSRKSLNPWKSYAECSIYLHFFLGKESRVNTFSKRSGSAKNYKPLDI